MVEARIRVEVFWQPATGPGVLRQLELAAGATLADAVEASGIMVDRADLSTALWGRLQPPHTVLQDGDRVDLLRPLKVDPKEARRQRARRR